VVRSGQLARTLWTASGALERCLMGCSARSVPEGDRPLNAAAKTPWRLILGDCPMRTGAS